MPQRVKRWVFFLILPLFFLFPFFLYCSVLISTIATLLTVWAFLSTRWLFVPSVWVVALVAKRLELLLLMQSLLSLPTTYASLCAWCSTVTKTCLSQAIAIPLWRATKLPTPLKANFSLGMLLSTTMLEIL